jgi:hypothetical protein
MAANTVRSGGIDCPGAHRLRSGVYEQVEVVSDVEVRELERAG